MLKESYPYYLANKPVHANTDLEVTDKYTGEVATRVAMADTKTIDRAIAAAVKAAAPFGKMPAYQRQDVLQHCVNRFRERFEELSQALCVEAGKPIKDSRGEVNRLIDTFRIAAEESVRLPGSGEYFPLDISARAVGYTGQWKRVPIGPCSFITPFNFPLNLVAHKVAPALAVGCPFILKPASMTPVGALIIGEILAETNLPEGAFSVLPCRRDGADLFTVDDRLKLLSFTGSPDVGWDLKARAGKKKVVLELGGNAAVIVDEDVRGPWMEDAVGRIILGAFYQSGQSCIGVQRVIAHEAVYEDLREKLVTATKTIKTGDPRDEDTFVGPMISEKEVARLQGWVDEAVQAGATVLCGGIREGLLMQPTLLENVDPSLAINCREAFGPVAVLSRFRSFDEALQRVNDSVFGLQTGVFTRDLYRAQRAWDELDVGGVVVGDVPSWRVDHMPYGGVKDSGLGREGIRWAIEDMSEVRLLVVRTPPIREGKE